jgi:hypothetical protein
MIKNTFEDGEIDVDSELRYLKEIRNIRDKNADLFARIKMLPKKARTARNLPENLAHRENRLLTFFRKGRLKKFVIADSTSPLELTFLEAARLFECSPDTPSQKIPAGYFDLLQSNKDYLEEITGDDSIDLSAGRGGGSSNEAHLLKTLKAVIGKFQGYTDDDEEYLKMIKEALEHGTIPRNTSKRIKQKLKKNLNPAGHTECFPGKYQLRRFVSGYEQAKRACSA